MTDPNSRRIALFSRRHAERRVWHASQYEFEDVIAAVDDARLVTPAPVSQDPLRGLVHGATNRLRRRAGLPRVADMRMTEAPFDADLFFAIFAAPHEIAALPLARAQLSRSRHKVAFIIEMYTTDLPRSADYIRQLRGFDHIFLFTRDVIPDVARLSGVPTSFLATGVDATVFAPERLPRRTVDVTSYGRRLGPTHAALRDAMRAGRLEYDYDTVHGPFDVTDHVEHREMLAARLQRSRFTIVYKNNDEPKRIARTGGEETLTNRFFEATAAGSVVLGSAPDVADFVEYFGWPDAVIDIPAPAPGILSVIEDLSRDGDRLLRASRAGIRAAVTRHDWAFRWREVLAAVELVEHPMLGRRLQSLSERLVALDMPDGRLPR